MNLSKTRAEIMKLPKWFRFAVYYGLLPLWLPVVLAAAVVAWCIISPIVLVSDLWEDFK